jgi:hypothetical protein
VDVHPWLRLPLVAGYWAVSVVVAVVGALTLMWLSVLLAVGSVENLAPHQSSVGWSVLGAALAIGGPACGVLVWRRGRAIPAPGRLLFFGGLCFAVAAAVLTVAYAMAYASLTG